MIVKRISGKHPQPIFKMWIRVWLILMMTGAGQIGFAQRDSVLDSPFRDSAQAAFFEKLKKAGDNDAKRSVEKFNAARVAKKQEFLLNELLKTTHAAKDFLKSGLDTLAIHRQLSQLKKWSSIAGDGVFTNTGTSQTYRNLATTGMILFELQKMTQSRNEEIDHYQRDLTNFRYKIDSLYSDSVLYEFAGDSAATLRYLNKIFSVVRDIGPADTALQEAIGHVAGLQTDISLFENELDIRLQQIEDHQKVLSEKIFKREFANLTDPAGYDRPFSEILSSSEKKGALTIWFYTENNLGKILIVLLLIGAMSYLLISLKQKYIQGEFSQADYNGHLVLRYPVYSSILIILCLFQFIFRNPPFIFSCLFWIISAICLTIIFSGYITRRLMNAWVIMLTLFLLPCLVNLVLQASRTERWFMLLLASAGVICGCFFLFGSIRKELREKLLIFFISLVVLMELGSVIANICGRYNLSKTLLTSGYFNFIIGILFLWTVRLVNEILYLGSKMYTGQERKLFYINFERVGDRAPMLLYILMVTGWLILMGRNFYAFKLIIAPVESFLVSERTLGEYSFSIFRLLSFFGILLIAAIVSKIVSFFASDQYTGSGQTAKGRKAGVGSWLLLIRVAIIGVGVLLAFAAAGLPMDRIAIILGALGVGIGFGLQTLTNNLVSGLIIAFEKPVNVGDIVEIAGQSGTMKSIGFRSSVISRGEGADVVIPNGDLLNAHLINWTLGGGRKRIELIVGIEYGTDLDKTRQVLLNILGANVSVLKFPEPAVMFRDFSNRSIDITIQFWVRDQRDAPAVKSEVIASINHVFKENRIIIPIPQHDIFLHPAIPGDATTMPGV